MNLFPGMVKIVMMTFVPADVAPFIRQQLPDLGERVPDGANVYNIMNLVRDYACEMATSNNFQRLKDCFTAAEALYEKGSGVVRCAVENVVIYSLSRMLMNSPQTRDELGTILPGSLRSVYMSQVMARGY